MRIISGIWKGRPLSAPSGTKTRPTSDRVKEAIFSMIGPYFEGGYCLDVFAGSGALGLEALSRGMNFVVFIDSHTSETIKKNIQKLDAKDAVKLLPMSFEMALKKISGMYCFDLVFLDPPYALGVMTKALDLLVKGQFLQNDAIVVAEMDHLAEVPVIDHLQLLKCSEYGVTKVCIYKHVSS